MTIFFTSDTHYYHANIIKYSRRPFKHVDEMNEALITNYNSVVKPEDTVYHLGDFGFSDQKQLENVLRRLNGNKHLILGNHDRRKVMLGLGWGSVHSYLEIKVPDEEVSATSTRWQNHQHITLFHFSCRVWNKSHHGSWQLYGHSHGTLYNDPSLLSMDVGVDPCGYFPISYEQVKEQMKKKTWKPADYHGKDRD